ncbi:MAG TPA: hypothetical protein VGB67_08515, partial [Fibrella sp.]
ARDLGMKRYSKLRKAELVAAIAEHTYLAEREAELAAIEAESTPHAPEQDVDALFSAIFNDAPEQEAPVKAPESAVEAPDAEDGTEDEVHELVTAYGLMHTTWTRARGDVAKRLLKRLINIRTEVKRLGGNPVELRMGYCVA